MRNHANAEQVPAEAGLHAGARRFRALVENAFDAITVFGANGETLYESPNAPRVLGFAERWPEGRQPMDAIHPDDRELTAGLLRQVLAKPNSILVNVRFRMRHADESYRWIEASARNQLDDPDVRGLVVNWRDIHASMQAQADLRESEERFRAFMDHNPFVAFIKDAEGRYLYGNQSWLNQFGAAREQALGRTDAELWPADIARYFRAGDQAVLCGGRPIETVDVVPSADGQRCYAKVKFPLRGPGGQPLVGGVAHDITELRRAEASLRQAHAELEDRVRVRTADLLEVNRRLKEEITERLRAEDRLQKLQDELAHVARVSTMGELATSLAHEINQPLTAISNYASACARTLRANPGEAARVVHGLENIIIQAQRAGEVVRRVRGFVARRDPVRNLVPLAELIGESLQLIEYDIRAGRFQIERRDAPELPPVLADRVQIEQVLLNLIRNALEAMADTPDNQRRLCFDAENHNGQVRVRVADRGRGLDPEIAAHLFEPFRSTKERGLGMGLAISRSIVEAHGGKMGAEPNSLGGTVFWFTLPTEA